MSKGYSLIVEVEKNSYAVVKISQEIYLKAKELSVENISELPKFLEDTIKPENIMAADLGVFEAAGVARGVSDEFFIIDSREKII